MEQIYDSRHSGQEVDKAVDAVQTTLPAQVAQIGSKLGDLTQLQTSAKTSAVAAINEVNSKLIKLSGWSTSQSVAMPNIGDYGYLSDVKKVYKRLGANFGQIEEIPYYDGALYTYRNEIFVWNGTDLVESTLRYKELIPQWNLSASLDTFIITNIIVTSASTYRQLDGDKSIILPVKEGDSINIKTGSAGRLGFCASFPTLGDSALENYYLSANATITKIAPSNAKYVIINTSSVNTFEDITPIDLSINDYDFKSNVNEYIAELVPKVDALDLEIGLIGDDNALIGSVVRTDSSGSRKEEKIDIVAGVKYTVTSSSNSSQIAYIKFYDINDTQIGSNYSVGPGKSSTQVAPDNAVSLGISSYGAIDVNITMPGKIRQLKEEIDQDFADMRIIDNTLFALTTDGSLASSSKEMGATGGMDNMQVFIKEGTSLIIDKGGDAEISNLSVSLRDKSGQSVFYRNLDVKALPYTINATADIYKIGWGCASASYVITPGTLTISVTTKECISSIRQDISSIEQDLENVNDEIEGVKDEIEEIKKVPFTINGLQTNEQVFTRNAKAESIQTISCPLYGLDERIINPDNLRTRDRGIAEIPGSIFRVNCNLYKRWAWYQLQDEQGNIDFTLIRNQILDCAENHTRLHTRVFYWSGSVYDKNNLKYPTDYSEHQDLYDTYFTNSGITFQDGVAYVGSKPIILGYPSFVFWDMVKEGTLPYLQEDSSAYTGIPNYDSETLYTTWYNCLTAFSQFIEQTIDVSYLQSPLKIKNCIELLQGGSVGIYGEGFITNYGGHFPSTTEKLTRYFTAYITLFPDVRLSFPLGMYYDRDFYGIPTIEQILNSSNTMGKVALFVDVIGWSTDSYKSPDYNPISKSFRDVLDSDNRQIEGETAGSAIGVGAPTLLTDIYIFHFYGATLANYVPYAPLGYSQLEKAQTLIGSKFALVRSGYNSNTGKIRLDLQNLGVSKIFSPYWKITYVFRDTNGEKISSVDSNISIQDIAPNSNMYDEVGLVVSKDMTEESITIPANTKRIYLAIVDKYGIYPNYFLLNKNRTENGEYIIATL